MNAPKPSSVTNETSERVIARIDAQEEEFVTPIREYLESNGCQVVVNQRSPEPVAYHIATGDSAYVKSIFAEKAKTTIPTLGIVIGTSPASALKELSGLCKIVVVSPTMLTSSDVVEIFSFYFAGNSTIFDKRRNIHEQVPPHTSHVGEENILHQKPFDVSKKPDMVPTADKERIGHIISDVFNNETNEAGVHVQEKVIKHRRRRIRKNIWITLLFICIAVFFPVIWYGASISISAASFAQSAKDLQQNNSNRANTEISVGNYWLHQAQFSFGFVAFPFRVTGYNGGVRGQERLLSFLTDISKALGETNEIVKNGKDVATLLLTSQGNGSSGSPASAVNQLRLSVVSVSGTLGLAKAELAMLISDRTFPFRFSRIQKTGVYLLTVLEDARATFTYIDEFLTLYPNLAGYKEAKTYLVLLQNSNELRPTGGFIGSVGVIKFEDGILSDFRIDDVYTLDGQLKGHVDPPLPIRDLLGQEHWYLRDSNWSPDFKESAIRAAWFYQKEGGESVDGVIAINSPLIVGILCCYRTNSSP